MDFGGATGALDTALHYGTPINGFGTLGGSGMFGLGFGGVPGGQSGYSGLPFDYGANRAVDHDRISQEFTTALGRAPTQNELDLYGNYIKTGDLQYGDIGKIIQAMPEAMRSRLSQQQQEYGNILSKNNDFVLGQAANAANASFAQNGRQFSSGQGNSVLQAGQQLAAQQSPLLANFYGQGQSRLEDTYNQFGAGSLQRAYNLQDQRTSFNRGLLGYQTQRNDFNTDLTNQRNYNRQQAFGQLAGGVAGAGAGYAMGGGLPGAQLGAGIGSRAGGLFGS